MKHFFKILKITFLVSFVFITGTSFSQDGCGYDEALKEALKDTNFLKKYVKEQSLINQQVKKIQASGVKTRNIITIPVVVHILYRKQDGDANLIYDRVKSQIDILNKHFNATDPVAINNSHPYYKSDFAANCQFNFVLANKDPNGKPTTGIVRKRINSYLEKDTHYCDADSGGSTAWNTYKYLNIYVLPKLKNNINGSYKPSLPGTLTDVVFVKASCFGEGSEDSDYSFGSTCSHEVGHWLSLEHIWGDRFKIFGRDLIYDTPSHIYDSNQDHINPNGTSIYPCGGFIQYPNGNTITYPNNPDASPYLIGTNSSGVLNHVAFDDDKECGLVGSPGTGLYIFYDDKFTYSSTYTTNGKFIDYLDSTNYVFYPSSQFNNLGMSTATVRDIIKTDDGKYFIAAATNGVQANPGGVYICQLTRNGNTLLTESITPITTASYCNDLTFDENNNVYAAFGQRLSGTTTTEGGIGKWNSTSSSWQYTSAGLPSSDRRVLRIHCDTINDLLYTLTDRSCSGTCLGPYLSAYNPNTLSYLNQFDFTSLSNTLGTISMRGIVTDKNGRIWIGFNAGGNAYIQVYEYNGSFNLLFETVINTSSVNLNGLKYDNIGNIYIQTSTGLTIINKASTIANAGGLVNYNQSPGYSATEKVYEINTSYSGLALDYTNETMYLSSGGNLLKVRIPYKGNEGGRMYNNLMDYIKPSKNRTIFTNGQNERMHATFDTKRLNLQSSDGYIAGGYCPSNQNLAKVGLAKVTNLTCNAVKLRWDKNPCVDKYHLRYRISTPQGSWIFINNIPSNKTSYVLNPNNSSLAPNTTYEYQIISVKAGFSNISSDLGSFKTLSAPCRNEEEENEDDLSVGENEMMIYPNPNSGKFNISYSFEDESDILVKIINMYGQVLYESNRPYDPFTNTIEINADLPAGYYIVSITNDNSSLNKGIIISR